jgi:outer membrane protein OmpA-like peptidoglycan-associated protein
MMVRSKKGGQMSVRMNQRPQANQSTSAALQATGAAAYASTSRLRRPLGLASVTVAALLSLTACSTMEDAWDSIFSEDGGSTTASSAANAAASTASTNAAVAVAGSTDESEPEGLRAAPKPPDYANNATRRQPNERFALDESGTKTPTTAVAVTQQSAPTQVAEAVQAAPAPTPVAPPPTPAYDPVASDPDATVIIGGDGNVTVDPSVRVAYQPLVGGAGNGIQPLSAYNPAGAAVSSLVATIQFGDGSASLNGQDRQILQQVVSLQRQYGGALRVVGHASARTADMSWERHDRANEAISQARAKAVSKALIALGAPRGQLYAGAVGDSQPLYEEVMPAGEAGNRRAEIYLDY